jgi:hypothetical protein
MKGVIRVIVLVRVVIVLIHALVVLMGISYQRVNAFKEIVLQVRSIQLIRFVKIVILPALLVNPINTLALRVLPTTT